MDRGLAEMGVGSAIANRSESRQLVIAEYCQRAVVYIETSIDPRPIKVSLYPSLFNSIIGGAKTTRAKENGFLR